MKQLARAMAVASWCLALAAPGTGAGGEAPAKCLLEIVSGPTVRGATPPYTAHVRLRARADGGRLVRRLDADAFRFSLGSAGQRGQPAKSFARCFDGDAAPCVVFVVQTAGGPAGRYEKEVRPALEALAAAIRTAAPDAKFGVVAACRPTPKELLRPAPGTSLLAARLPETAEPEGRPALLEALLVAVRMLPRESMVNAIVAFTDGDTGASRLDPIQVTGPAQDAECPIFLVSPREGDRSPLPSVDRPTWGRTFGLASWKAEDMAREILDSVACEYAFELLVTPARSAWPSRGTYLNISLEAQGYRGITREWLRWPGQQGGDTGLLTAIGGLLLLAILTGLALALAVRSSSLGAPPAGLVEEGASVDVSQEFHE